MAHAANNPGLLARLAALFRPGASAVPHHRATLIIGGASSHAKRGGRGPVAMTPRAYDAGRITRRDPDFVPRGLGPNAAAEVDNLGLVRRRIRDLLDNNDIIDGAVESWLDVTVGSGIDCEPDTGWRDADAAIDRLWEEQVRRVDPSRLQHLFEQQRLFGRELAVGEAIVVRSITDAFNGAPPGPAMEILPCERIDLSCSGTTAGGNLVRQGIETDRFGRRIAAWILTDHPADGGQFAWSGMTGATGVIRESDGLQRLEFAGGRCAVIHQTDRRAGALRGVPRIVSTVRTCRMQDAWYESTMLLAQMAANFGLKVKLAGQEEFFDGEVLVDAAGNPIERMEPGAAFCVDGRNDVELMAPNVPGPQFEPTDRAFFSRISRAARISYAQASGDYGRTTFASGKREQADLRQAAISDYERIWRGHTEPFRRLCIDFWLMRGLIPLTGAQRRELEREPSRLYAHNLPAPAVEGINPKQDADAEHIRITAGTASRIGLITASGRDWRKVVREECKYEQFRDEVRAEMGLGPPAQEAPGKAPGKEAPEDSDNPADNSPDPDQENDDASE